MLGLKEGCVHPESKKAYIKAAEGGRQRNGEKMVCKYFFHPAVLVFVGWEGDWDWGWLTEGVLGCVGGISVWIRGGV